MPDMPESTTIPAPQRVELIWPTGERRDTETVPASPEDATIHVGDRLTCQGYRMLCLDEHDEPDGTHVVGVCLREHYGLITLMRALDGEPIVAFDDLDEDDQ